MALSFHRKILPRPLHIWLSWHLERRYNIMGTWGSCVWSEAHEESWIQLICMKLTGKIHSRKGVAQYLKLLLNWTNKKAIKTQISACFIIFDQLVTLVFLLPPSRDTEVSAARPQYFRAPPFLRLWGSLIHSPLPKYDIVFFCVFVFWHVVQWDYTLHCVVQPCCTIRIQITL